jgi:hypothetical protein
MEKHYPQILRQYMGEERDAGNGIIDDTTRDAAYICAASQAASEAAKRPELVSRKERSEYNEKIKTIEEARLRNWAKQNDFWITEQNFLAVYESRFVASGAEQKVYLKEDGKKVIKVNLGRFHSTWLEYFNRLLFHAFLFPATRYTTVGFTEEQGQFGVITEQVFFTVSSGATRDVVEPYLKSHGFERIKNEDYFNKDISVKLEDLHDENVLLDEDGNLLFIDP